MRQWHYTQEGQQFGPVAESDFVKLFESGHLEPDTMVWTEELEEWTVASDVDGLVPSAPKPPPPIPTPPPASSSQSKASADKRQLLSFQVDSVSICSSPIHGKKNKITG